MANRIQPHPNPPYLKGDGTVNVSGQLRLYVAGTTTAKIAYKDAAGTSYGSTIDLNSSGLPEDGPIFWDNTQLYKVEVYTRVDDTPTYALDYTVDSFGGASAPISNIITTTTSWTVDKVGATSTTFATIAAAMDEARNWIIMGGGELTINVDNGTYLNDVVDLSHPQGQYINIVGTNRVLTILEATSGSYVLNIRDGSRFGSIQALTIKNEIGGGGIGILARESSEIINLDDVSIERVAAVGGVGINVIDNSKIGYGTLYIDNCATAIAVTEQSLVYPTGDVGGDITITGSTVGVSVISNSSFNAGTSIDIDTGTTGITCSAMSTVHASGVVLSNLTNGLVAITMGRIFTGTTPTLTTVTTPYSPANKTILGTGAGTSDTALIMAG